MDAHSLHTIAHSLRSQLDCTQDIVCQHILHMLVEIGQPIALSHLAVLLQMQVEDLVIHLTHFSDAEFDKQGNIIGWGMTLLPTPHQFLLPERPLFTWCAFDTLLFPSLLGVEALVRSECSASGQPITFASNPKSLTDLRPATSMISLIVPAARCDCVRGTFCRQSLFFQSEEAASPWLALHPEAILLSIEEAATIGQIIAGM